VFKGLELLQVEQMKDIPTEWLKRLTDSFLTEEEKKQIEEMGGFDKLMEMLQERMKQAQEGEGDGEEGDENRRGNGRNFPIGANGYHPEGIRIGQDKGRHGKAIKVWDKREYKTSTTRSSSALATSRSPCAACASSPAPASRTSWT